MNYISENGTSGGYAGGGTGSGNYTSPITGTTYRPQPLDWYATLTGSIATAASTALNDVQSGYTTVTNDVGDALYNIYSTGKNGLDYLASTTGNALAGVQGLVHAGIVNAGNILTDVGTGVGKAVNMAEQTVKSIAGTLNWDAVFLIALGIGALALVAYLVLKNPQQAGGIVGGLAKGAAAA